VQAELSSNNPATVAGRTSRFVPFLIALSVCATSAVVLGFSAWYFFGKSPASANNTPAKVFTEAAAPAAAIANESVKATANVEASPASPPESPANAPPPGTLQVVAGIVELGGSDSTTPAKKVAVGSFFISETEVTNQQYQEFLKETHHSAPAGRKNSDFPPGTANQPITGVTWQDAVDYCQWLSTKLKETVRLPVEAEWELAARGAEGRKYPWGDEWDDRAAASENKQGFIHAVRSYPAGRSPCGAYDMAGNVWEWVGDVLDSDEKATGSPRNRVIKGGAANENRALISGTSRNLIPKDYAGAFVGFRYIVLRS